jgi:hypothetical protein
MAASVWDRWQWQQPGLNVQCDRKLQDDQEKPMNKQLIGNILIFAASALIGFFAYGLIFGN